MEGFMPAQNIDLEEIEAFFNYLPPRARPWGLPAKPILGADFITGIRTTDKELAGIGGVIKSYGLVPTLFIWLKPEFVAKGLSNEIMTNIIGFARKNYNFLILSVEEDNRAARHLYHKYDFKPFYKEPRICWMCSPFSKRGKLICKFLPLIYFVFRYINRLSPLAHILHCVHEYFLRRQEKRNRLRARTMARGDHA